MESNSTPQGPVLRLFDVRVKPGCVTKLLDEFATTSARVVHGKPGNEGYFFGHEVASDRESVIFASVWKDLDAVRARFGDDWQVSFLPAGYEDLIESCSVRHIDLSEGWHVTIERP